MNCTLKVDVKFSPELQQVMDVAKEPKPAWSFQLPYDLAEWLNVHRCTGIQYRDDACVLTSESGHMYVLDSRFQPVLWANDLIINLACVPVVALRPRLVERLVAIAQWQARRDAAEAVLENMHKLSTDIIKSAVRHV